MSQGQTLMARTWTLEKRILAALERAREEGRGDVEELLFQALEVLHGPHPDLGNASWPPSKGGTKVPETSSH